MYKIFDALLGMIRREVYRGVHPREIGMAVFLGTLAGFVSGWNLTLCVVLLAVLILRTPLKMFFQVWGVAAGIAWLLTPLTYNTGHFLLTGSPVGGWLAPHSQGIWLALFDLDRYVLIGGLFLAPFIAAPMAWTVSRVTAALQKKFKLLQEKMQASQQWQASMSIRIVCWLIFGSPAKAKKLSPKSRWIRVPGVIFGVTVLLPLAFAGWLYLPSMVEQGVLHGLTLANRAEVNAREINLSLSEGTLQIDHLQFADPDHLDRDRLRIDHLYAVLQPGPLLRGHVIVEMVLIDGLACDVPRQRRAKRNHLQLPRFDAPQGEKETQDRSQDQTDQWRLSLSEYTHDWSLIQDRLVQLQDLLKMVERLARKDMPTADIAASKDRRLRSEKVHDVPPAYGEMQAKRHAFGPPKPTVWLKDLHVTHLSPKWGLGSEALLSLKDVSSDPQLIGRPTQFVLVANDEKMTVKAQINVHRPGMPHEVEFIARDVSLDKLVDTSKISDKFIVSGGTLRISAEGTFTPTALDLPVNIAASGMFVQIPADKKLAGLSGDLWNQGLAKLGGLDIQGRLSGRWSSPRLRLNTKELAAQFEEQLRAAGHLILAQAVDRQLARGVAYVTGAVNDVKAKAQQEIEQQRVRLDAAFNQGAEAVAAAGQAVDEQTLRVQRQASQFQARANQETYQTSRRARQQITKGQNRVNEFLKDKGPLSNFGGSLFKRGGFTENPLKTTAEKIIDPLADLSRQQAEGQAEATERIIENVASAAGPPVERVQETSSQTQIYLQDTIEQTRGRADQTQSNVEGTIHDGADRVGQVTEQSTKGASAFVRNGIGEADGRDSRARVEPYTQLHRGSTSATGRDDPTQTASRRDPSPSTETDAPRVDLPLGRQYAEQYGIQSESRTRRPGLQSELRLHHPPSVVDEQRNAMERTAKEARSPQQGYPNYPRTPSLGVAHYSRDEFASTRPRMNAGSGDPNPSFSFPHDGRPTDRRREADRRISPPQERRSVHDRSSFQQPPTNPSLPPAASVLRRNGSNFYSDDQDPPYAYEAGGRYPTQPRSGPGEQGRQDQTATADNYWSDSSMPAAKATANSRFPNRSATDSNRRFSTQRFPNPQFPPREVPAERITAENRPSEQNSEWAITRWARNAGSNIKSFFVGPAKQTQQPNTARRLRQRSSSRQPRQPSEPRSAHRQIRRPVDPRQSQPAVDAGALRRFW